MNMYFVFFFSSRRRHTRFTCDWSSDVCSSDLPLTGQLLRKPFPAQTLAMMGVVKRWTEARGAAVIAECGTGKTLISLGAVHVHSDRKPFTAIAMVPPQ